jgi:hypothetical protein
MPPLNSVRRGIGHTLGAFILTPLRKRHNREPTNAEIHGRVFKTASDAALFVDNAGRTIKITIYPKLAWVFQKNT